MGDLGWIAWWDESGSKVCEWTWAATEAEAREHFHDREPDEVQRAPGLDGAGWGTESPEALRDLGVISLDQSTCSTCGRNDPTDGRAPHLAVCGGCDQCGVCGCMCEDGGSDGE